MAVTNVKAPTTATLYPKTYFLNYIDVSWSGASAGTNNPIAGYYISPQVSTDNINWSALPQVTINTSETYGTYSLDTIDLD